MTKPSHISFAAACAALIPLAFTGTALAADVTINLSELREGGTLYIGLQTEDIFLQEKSLTGKVIKDVSSDAISVTLRDVAPGEYSVFVWHDLDDDGIFDRAENGMPLDGWAMHKGAMLRGAPSWEAVSFRVTQTGAQINEAMIYPAP